MLLLSFFLASLLPSLSRPRESCSCCQIGQNYAQMKTTQDRREEITLKTYHSLSESLHDDLSACVVQAPRSTTSRSMSVYLGVSTQPLLPLMYKSIVVNTRMPPYLECLANVVQITSVECRFDQCAVRIKIAIGSPPPTLAQYS